MNGNNSGSLHPAPRRRHIISLQLAARRANYERLTRWRRLWVLRGYFGLRKKHPPPGSASQ
jgi:hypothetical protein